MSQLNPKVGFVSLGCPKALVDSERILTQLRSEGYDIVPSYDSADVVVVNTCGFIDSAVTESLDAIGEAMNANGKVIVTGCLGKRPEQIREAYPNVLAVSGPQDYMSVMEAVHAAQARSLRGSGARLRHQADPPPLRVSEDFRRLQPHVQLLHHSLDARQAGLAPGR